MLSSLLKKCRRYHDDSSVLPPSISITGVDACSDESSALLPASTTITAASTMSSSCAKVQRQQNHDHGHDQDDLFYYQHQTRYLSRQIPPVLPSSSSIALQCWNKKTKRKKVGWPFRVIQVVTVSLLSLLLLLITIKCSSSSTSVLRTPLFQPTVKQSLLPPSISTTGMSTTNPSTTSTSSSSTTTKKVEYGEVWLIRHGEKDDYKSLLLDENMTTTGSKLKVIRAMYELNDDGWNRAYHLKSLMNNNNNDNNNNSITSSSSSSSSSSSAGDYYWPHRFKALYATRPATDTEIYNSYPKVARDDSGLSLILREYQTLLPISEYMNHLNDNTNTNTMATTTTATKIQTKFSKSETKEAALDITKVATNNPNDNNKNNNNDNSNIVLVAWNHCSLPTLIVNGFGCKSDPKCYRCWSDSRFGDVLKLNVTLTTTTKTTTTTMIPSSHERVNNYNYSNSSPVTHVDVDYSISSKIISLSGEGYPSDHDYYLPDYDGIANNYHDHNSTTTTTRSAEINASPPASNIPPVSIERSTPCVPSYCTHRHRHALIQCLCYSNSSNTDDNNNSFIDNNNWVPLPPYV